MFLVGACTGRSDMADPSTSAELRRRHSRNPDADAAAPTGSGGGGSANDAGNGNPAPIDGGSGSVNYGTVAAPYAANDPINTRYTGTPGGPAGFDGSKFYANDLNDPWAQPIYYESDYVNKTGSVNLTVNCSDDQGFGKTVSFWAPKDFHAQVGSGGYSDGSATMVRADGSVVGFMWLGGSAGGLNLLPTTCGWFYIAGINQSGMKQNTTPWGTGFPGPRRPQWPVNLGIIDGYFMQATKPFRGLVFIVDESTNMCPTGAECFAGAGSQVGAAGQCPHSSFNFSHQYDGAGNNTGICEGQHFVIPSSTPKPTNLTAEGSYLWDVFVEYGLYDGDSGSNQLVVAAPIAGSSAPQVSQGQVDNINKDIAVLFDSLHFAND